MKVQRKPTKSLPGFVNAYKARARRATEHLIRRSKAGIATALAIPVLVLAPQAEAQNASTNAAPQKPVIINKSKVDEAADAAIAAIDKKLEKEQAAHAEKVVKSNPELRGKLKEAAEKLKSAGYDEKQSIELVSTLDPFKGRLFAAYLRLSKQN